MAEKDWLAKEKTWALERFDTLSQEGKYSKLKANLLNYDNMFAKPELAVLYIDQLLDADQRKELYQLAKAGFEDYASHDKQEGSSLTGRGKYFRELANQCDKKLSEMEKQTNVFGNSPLEQAANMITRAGSKATTDVYKVAAYCVAQQFESDKPTGIAGKVLLNILADYVIKGGLKKEEILKE